MKKRKSRDRPRGSALAALVDACGLGGSAPNRLLASADKLPRAADVRDMEAHEQDEYGAWAGGAAEAVLSELDRVLRAGKRQKTSTGQSVDGKAGGDEAAVYDVRAMMVDLAKYRGSTLVQQYTQMALWRRVRLEARRAAGEARAVAEAAGVREGANGQEEGEWKSFLDVYMGEIAASFEEDLDELRKREEIGPEQAQHLLESLRTLAVAIPPEDRALIAQSHKQQPGR